MEFFAPSQLAWLVPLRAWSFPVLPGEVIRERHPEFNWPDTILQGRPMNLSQRAGVHLFTV